MNKKIRFLFIVILLTPLMAFVYSGIFKMPKYFSFSFIIAAFFIGIYFIGRYYKILKWHQFIILSILFAFYFNIWQQILDYQGIITEKHRLTKLFHQTKYFSFSFILLIIYNTKFSKSFIENTIMIMKAIVIITSIVSVIQVFNPTFLVLNIEDSDSFIAYKSLYTVRRSSIFGFDTPASLGLSFVPLLGVLIGYMIVNRQKYAYLFLALGGISAFLSNTRFVMIGFVVITFIFIFSRHNALKAGFAYLFYILIGIAFFSLFFDKIGYNVTDWFTYRLLNEGDIRYTTRYLAISNFIKFFPESPIFGTGFLTDDIKTASNLVGSSHIHVGYLSHLVYYGLIGCILLFGSWYLMIRKLYKTAKSTNYYGSFIGFLTFFTAFATMSQSVLFYSGIIFCFVFDKYYFDKIILNSSTGE